MTTTECMENCRAVGHYYMLAEETLLKTAMGGIPVGVEDDTIKKELQEKRFKVDSVVRIRRDKTNLYLKMTVTL